MGGSWWGFSGGGGGRRLGVASSWGNLGGAPKAKCWSITASPYVPLPLNIATELVGKGHEE